MKAAKSTDYWRKVASGATVTDLEEFVIGGINSIAAPSLSAAGSLTVLCGANGTGKSTILESLFVAVNGARPDLTFGSNTKLAGADLKIKITTAKKTGRYRYTGGVQTVEDTCPVQVTWLNPGAASAFLQHQFASTQNFDELLEGTANRPFSADELQEISYLVGKDYTSVQVWEIEQDDGVPLHRGAEYLYYFRVSVDGMEYSSEEMGLGEYALFLLYWEAKRLGPNSMLLVEELESHISFRSQTHVLNFLAKQCSQDGLWALLTTHSPAILRLVPNSNVRLCYKAAGRTQIIPSPSDSQLAASLGITLQQKGVLLVEDAAAKAFLLGLSGNLKREIRVYYEISVAQGGSSKIDSLRVDFPKLTLGLKLLGIYDADAQIPVKNYIHDYIKLPGTKSPEQEVIPAIKSNVALVAARTGRSAAEIEVAIDAVAGLNPHDWFPGFVDFLQLNFEATMGVAVEAWLSTQKNLDEAELFFDALAKKL